MRFPSITSRVLVPALFLLTVLSPFSALAQLTPGGDIVKQGVAASGSGSGFRDIGIANLVRLGINAILGILSTVLLVIIVYAGILYLTAGGSDEKTKKAKSMLINAVIGIVIIFASYALTTFVIDRINAIDPATTTS